jgi:Cu(I)/Ag(I) efflux system membrane fusion protein
MKKLNLKKQIALTAALSLLAGLLVGRGCSHPSHEESAGGIQTAAKEEIWTCSMHPQIRQPKPGKCPICGMDLIPAGGNESGTQLGSREIMLSENARRLAEVETAPVERRSVAVDIRMTGKVQFDETRVAYIAPRVAGRIDRLYANFTGMPVKSGDPLADLYSPELFSAQQELLTAKSMGGVSESLLNATRERLRLWGLTEEQIAEIERNGQVRDHITFYSPIGGVVVEKEAFEGLYVEPGMRLFTVADLNQVWVQLNAYESDLALLRAAQEVELQAEAYPGETFKGTIAFIEPVLDPMTRTVNVRVEVPNPAGRLKPEMFVHAQVQAQVDSANGVAPLIIPASAPLVTGKRAVVYVAVPERDGVFEGRDVVLGSRAGDYYVVKEGLSEGERVVTRGGFKIDSSLQIQGKPSMMNPEGGSAPVGHQHGGASPSAGSAPEQAVPLSGTVPEEFRQQLGKVLDPVLTIAEALADDNFESARDGAVQAARALAAVDMAGLAGETHDRWMQSLNALKTPLDVAASAKDIDSFRRAFASLSSEMVAVLKTFSPVQSSPVYKIHCPMAFDNRGADWLQKGKTVRNPYFGKAMLSCGELTETISSDAGGHGYE